MKSFLVAAWLLAASSVLGAAPWQPLTALALSPDGTAVATGGLAGEVLWREAKTGEVLERLLLPLAFPVVALAFTDDSSRLQVLLPDGSVFDLRRGSASVPATSVPPALAAALARWRSAGPTMSGVELVWEGGTLRGGPEGRVEAAAANGASHGWVAHPAAVTGLALNAKRTLLYSCSFDGSLAVWSFPSGILVLRL